MNKEVNKIKSQLIAEVMGKHLYKKPLSANNESRRVFGEFCKRNKYERVGNANAFITSGESVYAFSIASDVPECRQFSKLYDGLACLVNGKVHWYKKEQLNIGSVTRIGSDGTEYFNVKGLLTKT